MDEHELYFFGLSMGDAADNSNQVERELKIKDLVESSGDDQNKAPQLQLKYPVCFECFDYIIKRLDGKIGTQEMERDTYIKEL